MSVKIAEDEKWIDRNILRVHVLSHCILIGFPVPWNLFFWSS